MNNPQTTLQGPSMTLGDIYYVLFRHKWKILFCSVAGLLVAMALHYFQPPPFQSEAKLFIRYVTESKTLPPPGDDAKMKSPDQRGETIINSELQILTSLDLAKQVAETIGPEKILAAAGGGNSLNRAASLVGNHLTVDVPSRSSVIRIAFKHPDPAIVQPVLTALINEYLKKHVEIHEAVGIVGDFLTQETDQLRSRLAQTEDELRKASNKAGVFSLEDTKKAYTEQIARIRQEIFSAKAELAERSSVLQEITGRSPVDSQPTGSEPVLSSEQVAEYRNVCARLDLWRKREQELLTQFTEESTRVKEARAQLAEAGNLKKKLEEEHPQLVRFVASSPIPAGQQAGFVNLATEKTRLTALQSKIKMLNSQLDEIRTEAANVDQMEASIMDLRRKKDLEEANYKYYAASLEQSRIDEALGSGRVSNISQIQMPSPPFRDWRKSSRLEMMVVAGGVLGGLAWAFLIELYFDRSVRRPLDVERMLGLHLFLAIPDISRKAHRRVVKAAAQERLSLPKAGDEAPQGNGGAELVPWDDTHLLRPFHETLRDRLIGYFESRNLTHKPKLVAVTGLGKDAGVTTIAAGLASCCSETGEGNVLLVDMTVGQGSAQQFYKGKAVCGLDDILDAKGTAQVQDKLFVVGEEPNNNKLSRALPRRFNQLVPKLKASDFDYIIFDMPPVSQISITPRLAGFMDMVLLVIESEKTDQNIVQRATTLLGESKAHVGAVLNKTRTYVPQKLHQEFPGNT